MTRTEIQDALAHSQEQISAYFQELSPADFVRPCTESGVSGASAWSPKDHLAHLTANEQGIQWLIKARLSGNTDLANSLSKMNPAEMQDRSNQRNQQYIEEHRNDSKETLYASLDGARQDTLSLLAECSDELLSEPAGDLFGPGMTVSDIFVVNARHSDQHVIWIKDGFQH